MPEKDDFYEEEDKEEESSEEEKKEPEKIKLGDKEYTQDELNELVKYGNTAKEFEDKYNRPISKYYPEYTKAQQRLGELEEKLKEYETSSQQPQGQDGASPEELKKQAISQAKNLGLVTVEDINTYIDSRIQAFDLLNEVKDLREEAQETGKPAPNDEDLLKYMDGENPDGTKYGSPRKAYQDMFAPQLKEWEKNQTKKIKPKGMETQDASTAGAKQPKQEPVTADNLASRLKSVMQAQKGSENA